MVAEREGAVGGGGMGGAGRGGTERGIAVVGKRGRAVEWGEAEQGGVSDDVGGGGGDGGV